MEPRVRRVRKSSPRSGGSSRALAIGMLVVALALIVILINFLFAPPRPKDPAALRTGPTGDEVGGTTNNLPQPRSHLIY